jgi:hypothetical protein
MLQTFFYIFSTASFPASMPAHNPLPRMQLYSVVISTSITKIFSHFAPSFLAHNLHLFIHLSASPRTPQPPAKPTAPTLPSVNTSGHRDFRTSSSSACGFEDLPSSLHASTIFRLTSEDRFAIFFSAHVHFR